MTNKPGIYYVKGDKEGVKFEQDLFPVRIKFSFKNYSITQKMT